MTGAIELPEGVEMVMPGDNVQMGVELIAPVAIEEGLRFAIREGGRTVGAGVVTSITRVALAIRSGALREQRMVARKPSQKIRIRLKAYDHKILDQSAGKIVETAESDRREGGRPGAAADADREVQRDAVAVHRQGLAGAVRDPHAQAPDRRAGAERQHDPGADAPEPAGRRRYRDQAVAEAGVRRQPSATSSIAERLTR